MKALKQVEKQAKKLVPDHWRKYFRASRYEVKMQRYSPVDLIVHIGGHWAEDADVYESYGTRTVLWVEADPRTYTRLCEVLSERNGTAQHLSECALVSAKSGEELQFHRFNNDGSSSSVHTATDTYKDRFPHSRQTGEVLEMKTKSLASILAGQGIDPAGADRGMLVLDVQGHELSILQGLGDDLRQFELCKCEVSRAPMYEGGARFEDIDAHFRAQGFKLISHLYPMVPRHGDVLYLRQ